MKRIRHEFDTWARKELYYSFLDVHIKTNNATFATSMLVIFMLVMVIIDLFK